MINAAFQKLKTKLELNSSYSEIVQQKHNAVRSVVENNIPGARTQLIGSLQRKTRIQPRDEDEFDIDILVVLGHFARWAPSGGITPQMADSAVRQSIRQSSRYESMGPRVDEPAIVFEYKDGIKIELVPAYEDHIGYCSDNTACPPAGRGYWIPKNGQWVHADYDYDAEQISALNKISDGHLIPTIKILKAIKRELFPQMQSFHLEILAANTIPGLVLFYKKNNYPINYYELVASFFILSKDDLGRNIAIAGSNSPPLSLNIWELPPVAKTFKTIGEYGQFLNTLKTPKEMLDGWKKIINILPNY